MWGLLLNGVGGKLADLHATRYEPSLDMMTIYRRGTWAIFMAVASLPFGVAAARFMADPLTGKQGEGELEVVHLLASVMFNGCSVLALVAALRLVARRAEQKRVLAMAKIAASRNESRTFDMRRFLVLGRRCQALGAQSHMLLSDVERG